jgi:hypothetical protein
LPLATCRGAVAFTLLRAERAATGARTAVETVEGVEAVGAAASAAAPCHVAVSEVPDGDDDTEAVNVAGNEVTRTFSSSLALSPLLKKSR